MESLVTLVVIGIALVLVATHTIRVVLRDDPGKRPTRESYDTRRPE